MIAELLLYKILQLSVFMIIGFILVKSKLLKSDDSSVLAKLCLYLLVPSVVINAFNVKLTHEITKGLLISFLIGILIHIILLILDVFLKKFFKATSVERASIIYSNAGNLVIPIVSYVLGESYVIYTSGYLVVQLIFMWTHGFKLFSPGKVGYKKIFLNPSIIAIFIGFLMMFLNLRLPLFLSEITSSLGAMVGSVGMIITGMLAVSINFKKMLKNKRLYFVIFMRLLIVPLIIMIFIKGILPLISIKNIDMIMLVSYFASITPSAATVVQFSKLYNNNPDYASSINVFTTVFCLASMPLLIMFF